MNSLKGQQTLWGTVVSLVCKSAQEQVINYAAVKIILYLSEAVSST